MRPTQVIRIHSCIVALLLATQAGLLAYSATQHSPTYLEPATLASGLANWEFGRFELYRVNPPLVRMVAAIPVMIVGYKADWSGFSESPGARAEFAVGEAFVLSNGKNTLSLMTYARWASIPFSLLGAYFAYLWATELYGKPSGLVALTLYVFEPNLLAHGELITPDAACTAFGIVAGYTFWKWLKQPSWLTATIAGGSLGLAELSKISWLILFALWPILWMVWRLTEQRPVRKEEEDSSQSPTQSNQLQLDADRRTVSIRPAKDQHEQPRYPCWTQLGWILLLSIYVINLGYGFDGTGTQLKQLEFVSRSLTGLEASGTSGNRFRNSLLGDVPLPLPKEFILGIDCQKKDFEKFPHQSYLRGEWRDHGWWYYYIYGLLVKVPCGIWGIALGVIAIRLFGYNSMASCRDEMILVAPAIAVMVLISSQSAFSIHLRYAFPALGLMLVFVGQAGQSLSRTKPALTALLSGLIIYTMMSCILSYPNHLRYFNDFVGGSQNGSKHLMGSSYDWGQDLHKDVAWIEQYDSTSPVKFSMLLASLGSILRNEAIQRKTTDSPAADSVRLTLYSADRFSEHSVTRKPLESPPQEKEEVIRRFPSGSVLVRTKTSTKDDRL